MSKNKRHQDTTFRIGKICIKCNKGKYEKAPCCKRSCNRMNRHVNHVVFKLPTAEAMGFLTKTL